MSCITEQICKPPVCISPVLTTPTDVCLSAVALERLCQTKQSITQALADRFTKAVNLYKAYKTAEGYEQIELAQNLFFANQALTQSCLSERALAEYMMQAERAVGYCDPDCCNVTETDIISDIVSNPCNDLPCDFIAQVLSGEQAYYMTHSAFTLSFSDLSLTPPVDCYDWSLFISGEIGIANVVVQATPKTGTTGFIYIGIITFDGTSFSQSSWRTLEFQEVRPVPIATVGAYTPYWISTCPSPPFCLNRFSMIFNNTNDFDSSVPYAFGWQWMPAADTCPVEQPYDAYPNYFFNLFFPNANALIDYIIGNIIFQTQPLSSALQLPLCSATSNGSVLKLTSPTSTRVIFNFSSLPPDVRSCLCGQKLCFAYRLNGTMSITIPPPYDTGGIQ